MLRLTFATAAFSKPPSVFQIVRFETNQNCMTYLLGILYYDYFITLGMEIELYWRKPISLGSFGFFLNRYLSVIGYIPAMIEFYDSTHAIVSSNASSAPKYSERVLTIFAVHSALP